ncbi:hypothetical protein PCE1_002760 [Barthelona sp. PCE]
MKLFMSLKSTVIRCYSEILRNRLANLTHVGELDKENCLVGTGMVGSPACGDVMRLQIKTDGYDPENIIVDAKFKAFGCGSALAAADLAAEMLIGRSLAQAKYLSNMELSFELKMPPLKHHCSILAEEAIEAAIVDLRSKEEVK